MPSVPLASQISCQLIIAGFGNGIRQARDSSDGTSTIECGEHECGEDDRFNNCHNLGFYDPVNLVERDRLIRSRIEKRHL